MYPIHLKYPKWRKKHVTKVFVQIIILKIHTKNEGFDAESFLSFVTNIVIGVETISASALNAISFLYMTGILPCGFIKVFHPKIRLY